MKKTNIRLAAVLATLILVANVPAHGEKPATPVKALAACVPERIKEDPGADPLLLQRVRRHNTLVEALTRLTEQIGQAVVRSYAHSVVALMEEQEKLVDNARSISRVQWIATAGESLVLAKGLESSLRAVKWLDDPHLLPLAAVNRIELEIVLEKAKREAEKSPAAK